MFFKHSKKSRSVDISTDGHIRKFPESPVNRMYKPRTLRELKELFNHTGINPAPVQLRDALPEIDGIDPMDTPPIPIGGDRFEHIRAGQQIEKELHDNEKRYRANQEVEKPIKVDEKPVE